MSHRGELADRLSLLLSYDTKVRKTRSFIYRKKNRNSRKYGDKGFPPDSDNIQCTDR